MQCATIAAEKIIWNACVTRRKTTIFWKNVKLRQTGKFEQSSRRVQLVDQEEEDEHEGNYTVLNVEGDEEISKPYFMEGFNNGNRFRAMIDSGSPVTIIAVDELKRIMKRGTLKVRDLFKEEKYLDFNGKPLNLLGYVFCELQVGDSYNKKARVLVARKGYKSIIGREWLSTLRYSFMQEKGELEVISIDKDEELSEEMKQFVKEFPKLFWRRGKIKNYQVQVNLKTGARIPQQKRRRIPIQLQKAVDEEIKRLPKEGHIERVDEIKATYSFNQQ